MSRYTALFFDLGGVCLTNAWDHTARHRAVTHFGLDGEDFERRHTEIVDAFERGELALAEYLRAVVFCVERPFLTESFVTFMQAQSQAYESNLDLVRQLAASGRYRLATINNESYELNQYRVDTFGLRDLFSAFFTSCFLGVRKPDRRIFEIALHVLQQRPADTLFADDRAENVAGAAAAGMRTVHVREPHALRAQLLEAGVEL